LPDGQKAYASSGRKVVAAALSDLDGQKLVSVEVDPMSARTRFRFDLGAELNLRAWDKGNREELWLLYGPKESVSSSGRRERRNL
jgi:hypothetical protein